MICEGCDCTDENACLDEETGEPCYWERPGLCSVCAKVLAAMEESGALRVDGSAGGEPRIEVYSEHEAQDYIERRRSMAAGGIG